MTIERSDYVKTGGRYEDTFLHDDKGVVHLGLWQPPPEFTVSDDTWRTHVVKQTEVGFLDLLAVRYFGEGMEEWWWVIAQANAIIDPDADMYPGQRLKIPTRALVTQFVSRSSRAV